ncbi:MAG: FliH/SctL family protein [Gammaproteobacteria bacterium]|jgi:flagellar assembly protein FliH|nr:FliH/SctL family protein [Gammaproteobacteria bacterium]
MSRSEEAAFARCVPWQAPVMGQTHSPSQAPEARAPALPTAEQIERIQREAWEEAYARGRQEGMEKGMAEARQQAKRLAEALDVLAHPLRELDERVVEEVVAMTLAIARHLVRRELRTDPGQIVGVVQQAAAALPVAAQRLRVTLHPDDAAIVREVLGDEQGPAAWEIIEDPALTRGGCRIETEHSRIDASVERRLAVIAAELLGGERARDSERAD